MRLGLWWIWIMGSFVGEKQLYEYVLYDKYMIF